MTLSHTTESLNTRISSSETWSTMRTNDVDDYEYYENNALKDEFIAPMLCISF